MKTTGPCINVCLLGLCVHNCFSFGNGLRQDWSTLLKVQASSKQPLVQIFECMNFPIQSHGFSIPGFSYCCPGSSICTLSKNPGQNLLGNPVHTDLIAMVQGSFPIKWLIKGQFVPLKFQIGNAQQGRRRCISIAISPLLFSFERGAAEAKAQEVGNCSFGQKSSISMQCAECRCLRGHSLVAI